MVAMPAVSTAMILNGYLVFSMFTMAMVVYASKEIWNKLKYAILRKRGYGAIKYYNRAGQFEKHVLKLGQSIKKGDTIIVLPPQTKSIDDGLPTIFYSYRDIGPIDFSASVTDEISPEFMANLFKEKEIITKEGMLKEEERKDQLDHILKLASAAGSVGACVLVWKLMTDLQPVIRAVS